MSFRYSRRNWLRQPSGLVYPDLGSQFVPQQVWLPQYTTKLWNKDRLTYWDSANLEDTVNTNNPVLMASPGGWAYANTSNTASTYIRNLVGFPNYNDCVGAVFLPFSTSAGAAFALSGEGGTLTTALRMSIGIIGTGNIGANVRLNQAAGTTVVVDSGVPVVVGRPVAVAFIVRGASDRSIYIDGVRYDDTQAGGSVSTSAEWAFTSIQAWKLGSAALAGQLDGHTLMAWSNMDGRDPGHEWLKKWTSDPWSMFDPKRRRLPIAAVTVYRPGSDIVVSGWTPSTGTDLFACIDETTYDDVDYISSPGIGIPTTMGFTSTIPSGTYTIEYRSMYEGPNVSQIRIVLLDSSDTIVGTSSWQTQSTAFTTYTSTITTSGDATKFRIETQL